MEVKCNPAMIAEVSLSFQDELTSTLQKALGVAVEIAVVEITKLLDRTLRDVQDKIQEGLKDNNILKFRLQTADTQLSTVRARLDQQPQVLGDIPVGSASQLAKNSPISCRVQLGHRQLKTLNVVHSSPIRETQLNVDSEHYESCESKETNANLFQRESPLEITQGGVCTHILNSDTQEEPNQHRLDETNNIKNDQCSMPTNTQAYAETVAGVLNESSSLKVAVKIEKDEDYGDPISITFSGGEEPNSDSLSLAQSQLLADLRPQPLQSENYQSTNLSQDQHFLSSSTSSHHTHLPKVHNNHHRNTESHPYPTGRSPYHCSLCGRGFNRKYHLKIHQRIHTGERPYACSVCSARFRHALTLTRHFRLHTGEKPYVCGQCGKTFRNGGGLRFHQC